MKKVLQKILNFSGLFSFVFFANVMFNSTVNGQTPTGCFCGESGIFGGTNGSGGAAQPGLDCANTFSNSCGCLHKAKWLGYEGNAGTVTFTVNVATAGNYNVLVDYTHAFTDGAHVMRITVNNVNFDQSLTSTGDWCIAASFNVSLPLNAGDNTIIFQSNGVLQSPDLVYFSVPAQPTGIAENSLENNVKIYTENKQIVIENNLSNEQGTVIIYDMLGKVISDKAIEANSKLQISYSNDTYAQQIYFVQVYMNNQTYTKKIFLNK